MGDQEQPPDLKMIRLAFCLKSELKLWGESNDHILEITEGTWLRARIEFRLALDDLWMVVRNECQRIAIRLGNWLRSLWGRINHG